MLLCVYSFIHTTHARMYEQYQCVLCVFFFCFFLVFVISESEG